MVKNENKLLIAIILLSIVGVALLGFSQQVFGVSNDMQYITKFSIERDATDVGVSEAILKLPKETKIFALTVDYDREVESMRDKGTCNAKIKYQIFNYQTNSYETIHDKQWTLREYDIRDSLLNFEGTSIYNNGIPERTERVRTRDSDSREYRRWDVFHSCLSGMNKQEAKQMFCNENPLRTVCTDSRKQFVCQYPDESVSEHAVDDEVWEHNDIIYFPKLTTFNTDYISNNSAKVKITADMNSCNSVDEEDFKVDLFKVETTVIDTYGFDGTNCVYKPKYTYQVATSDYYTKDECEYQNNITQCYLDEHCQAVEDLEVDCKSGECVYEEKTIIDKIFPEKEEPVNEDNKEEVEEESKNWILLGAISLIIIFIIFAVFKIRKKK